MMLFDHQNLGIETAYVEIYVILVNKMIRNIIVGNGGTFNPVYFFRIIVPPLNFC